MRIIILLTIFSTITLGCQANPINPEVPTETSASPVPPPGQGEITQVPPSIPTPADANLQTLVEKAKADLAQRLAVSANEIGLVEATSVTWPDSSLGCPQKDMLYTQVLTPGYFILLEYGGNRYEYHASSRDYIVTCENPSPPVPGNPINT